MIKRICMILLLMVTVLLAQTGNAVVVSVADITGDGSAHVLQTAQSARWVQIISLTTNSAVIRIGDSSVSALRGAAIAVGGGLMLPPIPSNSTSAAYYNLGSIYYYAANGDKISLVWGR